MDRKKYMDQDEIAEMIAAAKTIGGTTWLLVDVALQTGLRVNELARIKFTDFHLKRCCLTIVRSKKKTKVEESLPISTELAKHLETWAKDKIAISGPLFVGLRGPLTVRGLQQMWDRCRIAAGLLDGLSIHCARHTMAVQLLRKEKNLKLVQQQLGHSSPVTTANMYAFVTWEDHQEALNGLYG